jgi:hypothetical protein
MSVWNGADFDMESDLITTDPANYYAFLSNTYQSIGNTFFKGYTEGKLKYSGGGVFDIRADNDKTPEAYFDNYNTNFFKDLIVNGTVESPSLVIRGQVQLNAKVANVYCRGGYGTTKIMGTHGSIMVDEDSSYPLILDVGTNYVSSMLSVSANRIVINRGHLLNTGYNAALYITAGHVINQGIIDDGYYGVCVSGTGKFTNTPAGLIRYGRIGIDQAGGKVIQNGRMEHNGVGTEIAPIRKSSGDLTIGVGCRVKSNGSYPILCSADNAASRNVKFEVGWVFNLDPLTAHPSGYAPIPLLSGYSGLVDANID